MLNNCSMTILKFEQGYLKALICCVQTLTIAYVGDGRCWRSHLKRDVRRIKLMRGTDAMNACERIGRNTEGM